MDFNPDLENVSRERKLAELLMAKGFQQPQGQMISGYYVAPSFTQQLNPLANMMAGQAVSERADTKQLELASALRGKQQEALQDYMKAAQGTPAQMYQEQAGPMANGGNIPQQVQREATGPNYGEMFKAGTSRYASPQLQSAAFKLLEPVTTKEGETISRFNLGVGGGMTPIASGGIKAAPEVKQAMQMLGINKSLDQLSPQELQTVNAKIDQLNASKRSNVSVNIPTEGERKAGFMANILDRNILQMQTALGVDPSAVKPNVPASVVAAITGPNLLSRSITPAQRQIVEDSQLDVLDAALTLRTGAAYTKEQLNAMRETYFPVLGDKPQAVTAKRQRLETLLEGAYIASGRATPQRVSAPPLVSPPKPNLNQELNIPAINKPKFLGFENANS
jgi:hypothetical protein